MLALSVADLRFGYAGELLFSEASFQLSGSARAALVAPNGAGKSTLLRIIARELEPETGFVAVPKELRVGYYRQSHEPRAEGNVLDAFLAEFADVLRLRRELREAEASAASGTKEALDALSRAHDAYHLAQGDELERKVMILAERLGFTPRDMDRPVTSLSGGERGRLHLGVVLAGEPDLLLLDEPTNHLDIDTIKWLEAYLVARRGATLVVSHDRAFLDRTTDTTLELGTRAIRTYPVGYSDYVLTRQVDLERERGAEERQRAFIEKTEDFIRKNIAGQKTKQAQSRRKMLEKMEKVDRPEDVWAVAEKVAFRFAPAARTGDIVLDARGLGAKRGERQLFAAMDLLVRRGERIGIVGPNGAGKSTLLKLLAGRGLAEDLGEVKRGTNLQEGYFDQHLGELDRSLSLVDEVRRVRGDFTVEAARQYLARFRFFGDDPLRVVAGLSGGEKARLALAKLLLEPRNLLFLDEPTNHLDIPAAMVLEDALANFEGTVLLVSHDRRFLETVTTRIISVRDGACEIFSGGYRDFEVRERDLEREAAASRRASAPAPKRASRPPPAVSSSRDDTSPGAPRPTSSGRDGGAPGSADAREGVTSGKSAYEAQRRSARDNEKRERRIKELEDLIAAGEKELEGMRARLRAAPPDDWEALAREAEAEQSLARRVDGLVEEWTALSDGGAK